MDELCGLITRFRISDKEKMKNYFVHVTHINTPHDFYVRPTAYEKYVAEVETPRDVVEEKDIYKRQVLLYHSHNAHKFVRGKVCGIQYGISKTYRFFAIDYGFEEKLVTVDRIRAPQYPCIPGLAQHCTLKCGKKTESWTQEAIDAMKYFIHTENSPINMTFIEKCGSKKVVSLNTDPDITSKLIMSNHACSLQSSEGEPTAKAKIKELFQYKQLNVGDRLQVKLLAGKSPDSFFVSQLEDFKDYLNRREDFSYFLRQQKKLKDLPKIELGMPVGVYIHQTKTHERAYLKELNGVDEVVVQLIDLGRTEKVSMSKVWKMSDKFFNEPAAAIFCKAEFDMAMTPRFLFREGNIFFIKIEELGFEFEKPNLVSIN